jgi:hypothetical protein
VILKEFQTIDVCTKAFEIGCDTAQQYQGKGGGGSGATNAKCTTKLDSSPKETNLLMFSASTLHPQRSMPY